jgi:signal transduction histidine kinase
MPVDANAESLRLRTVLRDLVGLSAIPAAWVGREPLAVAAGVAETLIGLLQLDFVSVRLCDPKTAEAVEETRGDGWKAFPEWMETYLGTTGRLSGAEIVPGVDGAQRCNGVVIPIGLDAAAGVVAASCDRAHFPTVTDQLLLRLVANQAATAFHNACLIDERSRAEEELRQARNELEVKVAEQTAEHSALQRVATLVARGVPPEEVFAAVTDEVGQLLSVEYAHLGRYEPDGTVTFVAASGGTGVLPVGAQFVLGGKNVSTAVAASGLPVRIDSYADASGSVAVAASEAGIHSSLGTPVLVEGRLWGVMIAGSALGERLPADTEARLAEFTELLAVAIANAESGAGLARLAGEQAALRRVATLVARGTPSEELFAAVVEEVGRLLPAELANLARYEADGTMLTVATSRGIGDRFPVGGRSTLGGKNVSTLVFETGRPARIDNYADAPGPLGVTLRERGVHSGVGAPITVEGRPWGMMAVGSTGEQRLPLDTEWRLADFTELVATAIANAESRAELTASRARIVAAADDTRRRIERDLHDGAQQQLVTLGLKLRSLASTIPPEFEGLHADVGEVASGLDDVLDELRELSRGIHPAVLSTGGLGPAIKTLARRAPIPVEVDVRVPARPPEGIEVAVYYVIAEALTNVAKHGQASVAVIVVEALDGGIRLSVSDNGVGGVDLSRGSGLVGLQDRLDALGARMTITSPVGEGTSIVVHFPVTSR